MTDRPTLSRLHVENYRSLRNVTIDLANLTVVTGGNGSGKSNLYQALRLLQAAAQGSFKHALLEEGGMPSALWAGPRARGPVRMRVAIVVGGVRYELTAGLVPKVAPDDEPPMFVLDPEIKDETVHLGAVAKPSTRVVDRHTGAAHLTDADGRTANLSGLDPAESILGQVREPSRYPELADLSFRLRGWRFYHHFDTSADALARRPQPGVRTDVLAADGRDLGAAIATLEEAREATLVHEAVDAAFPGYRLHVRNDRQGWFVPELVAPGLHRPLAAGEFSDGQLRFVCLAVALLSRRPPELLVLNEPETSLHPRAVAALAPLILEAGRWSQVWVTTHDTDLRNRLRPHARCFDLSINAGATHAEELENE